ncbi:MAG: hypothetical protein H0W01_07765 [Pseudonocardiales bacterium]|nr:hypothetical protein [Pseudonocardiales bacterium]
MTRLFWLGFGLAAGAAFARRTTRVAQRLTGQGVGADLGDGLREVGAGIGAFGAEIRAGMATREQELTDMVEQRTGTRLPTVASALADDTQASGQAGSRRARARRAGA